MQITRFHSLIKDFPASGEHVLYNTLTDQHIGLDDSALSWMESLEQLGAEHVAPVETSEIEWLLEEGFLVHGKEDDEARLASHLSSVREGDGTLRLTLMVTRSCNLACPYCFEGAGPTGASMSPAIEDSTHQWVLQYMERHGLSRLFVQYFGGEPLLKKPLLLRTAKRFSRELAAHGRSFGCSIITNGVLLDRPFAEQMASFGLEGVKVTLDGTAKDHDQLRPTRDGKGTWSRIIAGLKDSAGAVPLHVGSNVPPGKEGEFLVLIDALKAEGLGAAITELNFKPVLDAAKGLKSAKAFSGADPEGLTTLKLKAHESGMASEPGFALGPCGLHMSHYIAVDPEGFLFKCEVTMSSRDMSIGHVEDEGSLSLPDIFGQLDPTGECGECPYLPACAGGCRAVTWAHEGTFGRNCERRYFETVGRELIKQRYLADHYGGELPRQSAA